MSFCSLHRYRRVFALGAALILLASPVAALAAPPPGPSAAENPQETALLANLYMETSAEYEACCLQTYSLALERLKLKLAARPSGERAPAVVMDLDETVFDNSGFQAFLDRKKLNYSDDLWSTWEKDYPDEVRLVPGAKGFIDAAQNLGVTVIYITNRSEKNRAGTVSALQHLNLGTDGIADRLLLQQPGQGGDKSARRQSIAAKYDVLLYFGDNLRDFSEDFVAPKASDDTAQKAAIDDRRARVERAAYRFGNDWIILPNPVYGEWQRLLGKDPRSKLRETKMKAP